MPTVDMAARYWDVQITYRGTEGRLSGYGSGKDTEEAARADLVTMTVYYRDLGYTIEEATLSHCCSRCSGQGDVLAKRNRGGWIGKRVKCPVCKGKQSTVVVETLHEECTAADVATAAVEGGW